MNLKIRPEELLRAHLLSRGFAAKSARLSNCEMTYLEHRTPNQPLVLFIHGIGGAAVHYDKILRRMTRLGYDVLAPDLPGHGFSDEHELELTPDRIFASLVEFVDKVAPQKFFLVGNSLGGALALRYAIKHPERLLGVAALSPAGGFEDETEWRVFLKGLSLKNSADVKQFFARIYATPPWYLPLIYRFAIHAMNRKGVQDLIATTTLDAFAEGHKLPQLNVPLLFVWGKAEKLFPAKNLLWFKRHLPKHAIIEEPQGVGHCPQLDSAPWLNSRLHDFFVSCSS